MSHQLFAKSNTKFRADVGRPQLGRVLSAVVEVVCWLMRVSGAAYITHRVRTQRKLPLQ